MTKTQKLLLEHKRLLEMRAAYGWMLGSGKISRDEYFSRISADRWRWKLQAAEEIRRAHSWRYKADD